MGKKLGTKGLTLGELLLAAAILAFVICGLIALYVHCSILNAANRNVTLAMTHAQYVMEEIRDYDFTTLESTINAGNWDWDIDAVEAEGLTALSNEVIDSSVFQSGDPLGVTVRVDYKDRNGRDRFTELQTLLTDYQ